METATSNPKLDALTEKATAAIAAFTTSEAFTSWLASAKRFYKYSFMNQLLIVVQMPTATHVAGYNDWIDKHNRHVIGGEKGIGIYCPMIRKNAETGDDELRGFRVGYVFDVAQTDGEPLPPAPKPIEPTDPDFDPDPWSVRLEAWLAGEGVAVIEAPLQPGHYGYYSPLTKKIALSATLEPLQRFTTLLHESAHYIADHRKIAAKEAETVAETASLLAAAYLDLDTTSFSIPYVGRYSEDLDTFKSHLTTAHSVAQKLTGVLTTCRDAPSST